mgnify:FL=1
MDSRRRRAVDFGGDNLAGIVGADVNETDQRLYGPFDGHRVRTETEYRRVAADYLGRNRSGPLRDAEGGPPKALVNHGYWMVRCICSNCPLTSPAVPIACCMDCGLVWHPLFPSAREIAEIESLLLRRPVAARNYDPVRETVEHIRWENEHRGIV